jgi:RNA polymerase sigma-70 factor, ECF subfamily
LIDWMEPSDSELMQRVCDGDDDAFAAIVDRYKDSLVNYLTHVVRSRERAEDVAQEAFVRLYRNAARYRDHERIAPYLFRIATNHTISEMRREKRWRLLLPRFEAGTTKYASMPDVGLLSDEVQRKVSAALETLPLKFRAPLALYEINSQSCTEENPMIRKVSVALLFLAATTLFADPADTHHRTVFVKDGKIISSEGSLFRRVYLGFSPLDVSPDLRAFLGAPKDGGVVVQSVKEGSPAAKAGLRVGDVVMAIDGKPVDSAWTVGDTLDDKNAGDAVRIDIIRNHQRQTITAALEEREPLLKMETLDLPGLHNLRIDGPQMWKARVEATDNCTDLQERIKDLETRLKSLEKKLPK